MHACNWVLMKNLLLLSAFAMLCACTKDARTNRKLPGNWTLDVVRIEDGEGFQFFDSTATGSFSINAAKISGSATYTYSYFGQYNVTDSVHFEQRNCSISKNGEMLLIARETDTLEAKIIVLTNERLTFEYYDYLQFRLKRWSCSRN